MKEKGIYSYNTHTNKREVLERLHELKKDVLDYADYNHYMEYDYNVELTLKKLDEVYEAILTTNKNYGKNHRINKSIHSINELK